VYERLLKLRRATVLEDRPKHLLERSQIKVMEHSSPDHDVETTVSQLRQRFGGTKLNQHFLADSRLSRAPSRGLYEYWRDVDRDYFRARLRKINGFSSNAAADFQNLLSSQVPPQFPLTSANSFEDEGFVGIDVIDLAELRMVLMPF